MARNSLVCVCVFHGILLFKFARVSSFFPSGARQLPSAEQCAEALFCGHALGLRVLKVFNTSDHSYKLRSLGFPNPFNVIKQNSERKTAAVQTGDHMETVKLDPYRSH